MNALNSAPTWSSNPVNEADATEDSGYVSTLADDASDANSDPLAFAKVSGPSWLSVAADGALSGTPNNSDVGVSSFTVSVSDGVAAPVQSTLNITVINVNDAPVFAADPIAGATATEGAAYSGALSGSAGDDDGDALSYAKMGGPAWLNVAANGTLSGIPSNGDVGANSFSVNVSDGNGGSDTATLNITVINVNAEPAFAADPIAGSDATEDADYAGTLAGSASDDDDDPLTYAKVSGPAWLSVAADGTLSGTPANDDIGANAFTVSVSDGIAAAVEAILNITVNADGGGGVVFSDDFEPGVNPFGGTTQDVSSYTLGNTSTQANSTLWVRSTAGYGAIRNGLIDESENGGVNFTDPTGTQAYGFRYTNSGVTTTEGLIGALASGTTIDVSFDVVMDGHNSGTSYDALLVLFDAGATRNAVEYAKKNTAAVLARATGDVANDGNYYTVNFSYTVGDIVVDNDGDGVGLDTAFLAALLGKDIAIRFQGATTCANIDNVEISISGGGGPSTIVPDLVGLAQATAEANIVAANLLVGTVTSQNDAVVPVGDVISQSLTAGASVAENTNVDLVVSLGPVMTTVPNVVGLAQATAQANIVAANLLVGTVTSQNDAVVPVGDVISQSLSAGASVAENTNVDLVISLGPVMTTVPNVVNLTQIAAESAITAATLTVGTVTTDYSDTVSTGDVISQNPAGSSSAAEGTAVGLVVSLGVQMVTVPDVVGLSQSAAESAITAAVLTVGNVTTESSESVPVGDVISQGLTAGASVVHDTPLDLVVSLGDMTAPNPNPMTWAVVPAIGGGGAAGISYVQITDDADSGISSGNTYTHAIDWGTSGAATINGVVFANEINVSAGGRSNLGTRTYGPSSHGGSTPPAVSGDVASLFQDMRWNGPDPGYIELTGLTSGQWYDLRLYERAWDYQGSTRTFDASYDVGSDGSVEFTTPKINQNDSSLTPPGLSGNVSYAMSYVYQADASGKIKVSIDLADDHTGTYHLYGLTNQEIAGGGGDPETEITMTATTATDGSGVEYYFTETSGNPGGDDSDWQDSPSYTDTGLQPGTEYTYTVTARDKSPNQNATAPSAAASATTSGTPPDTTPPTLASGDIADDQSGGPVVRNTLVAYTLTFSEDMDESTVDAGDFSNAGSSTVSIGSITETSPGVFTVEATAIDVGTLQLQVSAGAVLNDAAGNALNTTAAIADDTTLTINPIMVTVPDVVSLTQAAAESAITTATLTVGTVTTDYSDTVPTGDVISQNPAGSSSAAEGTAVGLVVSLGVQMVTVPNVVGLTQTSAESSITAAILTVGNVTTDYSDTVPAGDVISQNLTAGSSIPHDTAVDFVVSLGVQMVSVPDVVGLAQTSAESSITAAILTVGNVTSEYSSTVPSGDVISQGLTAGASVPHDSAVDLVVSLGVDPSPKLVRTTVSSVSSSSWTTVNLGQTYNSAVIVATPIYPNNTTPPVVTRITNVTSTGFDLKIDRADSLTDPITIDVSVIAIDEGVYTQAVDGVTMEAVKYTSTVTSNKSSWVAESQTYQNTYSSPVVVGQVMSANDANWSVFYSIGSSRTQPADASNLNVGKHVAEDSNKTRADETIGYIVIESGSGTINGVAYEAALGADSIQGVGDSSSPHTYSLSGGLSTVSAAAASISGMDGNNGAWAVLAGNPALTTTSIGLYACEEQIGDSEQNHVTTQVGYIVFE